MALLSGEIAVVTGSARGQGLIEAEALAEAGAEVVLTDILAEEVVEASKKLSDQGHRVIGISHDVRSPQSWSEVIERTSTEFGQVTILVNNAAVPGKGSFDDLLLSDWNNILETNVTGAFLGAKACVASMRARGHGSIINVSSAQAGLSAAFDPAYGASKGAVRSLSKSLAAHLAPDGIRVNTIFPGFVATDMFEVLMPDLDGGQPSLAGRIPARRLAVGSDIAEAVVFLASSKSSYVVGAELVVDGGTAIVQMGYDMVAGGGLGREKGGTGRDR